VTAGSQQGSRRGALGRALAGLGLLGAVALAAAALLLPPGGEASGAPPGIAPELAAVDRARDGPLEPAGLTGGAGGPPPGGGAGEPPPRGGAGEPPPGGGAGEHAPRGGAGEQAPRGAREHAPRDAGEHAPRGGAGEQAPRGAREHAPRGPGEGAPRGAREDAPRSRAGEQDAAGAARVPGPPRDRAGSARRGEPARARHAATPPRPPPVWVRSGAAPPCPGRGPAGAAAGAPARVVDLNSAGQAELEALPGIGPAKARRILAWRERHGRFRRVADLRRVRGFGRKTVKRLAPLLTVGSGPPAASTP